MIHVSALHGTPLLVRLGALLVSAFDLPTASTQTRSDSTLGVLDAQKRTALACNVLSDASSLLSDDSYRRGVIGGSTLDGRTICVLSQDAVEMMQGVMSVWAAGGVAMPVMSDTGTTGIGHPGDWEASAILVAPRQRKEAEEMVRSWPEGSWITQMSSPSDADAVSDPEILKRYAEWVRDLEVDGEDDPALIIVDETGSRRTLSHAQVLAEVQQGSNGTDNVDSVLDAFWSVLSSR